MFELFKSEKVIPSQKTSKPQQMKFKTKVYLSMSGKS